MKTIGTANLHLLPAANLRTMIGALALEVYEACLLGFDDAEVSFAGGTLERYVAELRRRAELSDSIPIDLSLRSADANRLADHIVEHLRSVPAS